MKIVLSINMIVKLRFEDLYKVVPPKLCLLVYNPMKTVDISPTKTIVIGVINQLNAIYGEPPCSNYIFSGGFPIPSN